jgi:hypothetical protein
MSSDIFVPPVLTLPQGLVGLPDVRTLETVPIAGGQFVELLDPDDRSLGWLAAAAEDVRPGMTATLRATGRLGDDDVLLVLLASHGDPAVVTANLTGPLVVAPDGETHQMVLEDPSFELRARIGRLAPSPVEHP